MRLLAIIGSGDSTLIEPESTSEPAPAPEWLIDLVLKRSEPEPVAVPVRQNGIAGYKPADEIEKARQAYAGAALKNQSQRVGDAREGNRNATLNVAALSLGHLVAAGILSRKAVEASLEKAAEQCGLWAEGAKEVRATIASGLTKGLEKAADISHIGQRHESTRYTQFDPETGEVFPDLPEEQAISLTRFEQNDIGNAQRLIRQHGNKLRFVVNVGWHAWDGCRWSRDEGDIVARRLAHETAKSIFVECAHLSNPDDAKARAKWAISSGYSPRLSGMLAQSEPYLALAPDDLDRDPWLFNCANGTIDLRTSLLRAHDPADLITKISPVIYDPTAQCPKWTKALDDIFAGDEAMVEFVQRALGYSLTGITREHVLFILHGSGSNGKSVLLETVAEIFADYCRQCPSDTFTAKDKTGSGISNDIARLAGSRLVSVVETDQERRLAEGLVKQATGGDRMAARYMHQEFFEFTPKFKLWLATNHKPRIRGTDHGIWRRIRLLPFSVTFHDPDKAPSGEPIKNDQLSDELKKELPGILAYMVRGCADWQSFGLQPPVAVESATDAYRTAQDSLKSFLEDCCECAHDKTATVSLLYDVYKKWTTANGENPLSGKAFGDKLEEKGFTRARGSQGVRQHKGLDVNEDLKPKPSHADRYGEQSDR